MATDGTPLTKLLLVSDGGSEFVDRLRFAGFEVHTVPHKHVAKIGQPLAEFLIDFTLTILDDSTALDPTLALRLIREVSDIAIVRVTRRSEVTDCVVALELGADDYLREPIDGHELAARLRAVLRRTTTRKTGDNEPLVADDLHVYKGQRTVLRSGTEVHLTSVEFDLLLLLLGSKGEVVTRATISAVVLRTRVAIRNRAIDVHISGLRKKLGVASNGGERIKTVRGLGYVFTTLP